LIEITEPLNAYVEFPGPILLLAGPGTGKTYQLGQRVKFLIETLSGDPSEITVITFTNEAARNMREELVKPEVGINPEKVPGAILTMHSLGNAIIRTKPQFFGLCDDYDVLVDDHAKSILFKDAAVLAGYDRASSQLVEECRGKGFCREDTSADKCQICAEYRILLRKCMLVDYDDQIFLACQLLRGDSQTRAEWQKRTKFLLVDEYQDINEAQNQMIKLLTEGQEDGLFAVGDDDQSIYSFRGGSPDYVRHFDRYYGDDAKIGRLSKSWRCPEHILKGARAVVEKFYKDSVRKPEPTFSDKCWVQTQKIAFYEVPSEQWEANKIAKLAEEKIKSHTVTIIIPNGQYFPPIRDALRKRRIPYNYRTKFDERGIARFALLGEWVESQHNNTLLRQLAELVIANHDELTKAVVPGNMGLTAKREIASNAMAFLWKAVSPGGSLWQTLCEKAGKDADLATLIKGCLDEIASLLCDSASGKRAKLPRFLELSGLFFAPGRNPSGFLSEIREWKNERIGARASSSRCVDIYNMPSSKGLQAEVVFIVGASEGLMPSLKADLEEQSRLFYVAMTRAQNELYLFSARKRAGDITFHPHSFQLSRSRFIECIPQEHIDTKVVYLGKKKRKDGQTFLSR
jgi:DNA helicase-2/ATP-dependent DNA helicase PcrA